MTELEDVALDIAKIIDPAAFGALPNRKTVARRRLVALKKALEVLLVLKAHPNVCKLATVNEIETEVHARPV